MKPIKGICSVVVGVAALTVLISVGTAHATVLTNGSGANAGTIESTSETPTTKFLWIHQPCKHTYLHGHVTSQSPTGTAIGNITTLTYKNCEGTTFTTLKGGSFEIHKISSANAEVTFTGTELTVESSGFHCIYTTNNTSIGTLTSSSATGGTAAIDVNSKIPRTGGRSGVFCGSNFEWIDSFKVLSPDTLNID